MIAKWRFSLVAMVLSLVLFTGCSSVQESETVNAENTTESVTSSEVKAEAETKKETSEITTVEEKTEQPESVSDIKIITDMAGRKVELPSEINSVYGVNNNATYMLYTLVPEKIIGWNVKLSDGAKKYILDEYKDLPVLGALYGNATLASYEEILVYEPDVIVLSDRKASDKVISAAEEIQTTMEIPVIVIENGITSYDKAYELLGKVFGVEERAKELAGYYIESYEFAKDNAPAKEDQLTVYYARTKNGLSTDFAGSYHTELLDLIGAKNVATNENGEGSSQSGTVTLEQVIEWDPEVIITGQMGATESDVYNIITVDEMWAGIEALESGRVYPVPNKPFNWFDRPPSVNRIIGIKYIGHLLYPEIYTEDPANDIKEFFSLFYHYELSDDEVAALTGVNQ